MNSAPGRWSKKVYSLLGTILYKYTNAMVNIIGIYNALKLIISSANPYKRGIFLLKKRSKLFPNTMKPKAKTISIINIVDYGEVAQLARAFGSYPKGHVFESHLRYHKRVDYDNLLFIFLDIQ